MKVPEQVVVNEDDAWLSVGMQADMLMWRKWDANEAFSFPQMHSLTLSAQELNSHGGKDFFFVQEVCAVQLI